MALYKYHNELRISTIIGIMIQFLLVGYSKTSDTISSLSNTEKPRESKNETPLLIAQNRNINIIKGQLYFTCDLKESVVEALGMRFIREVPNGSFITNLFGAGGAEIIVRDSKNAIAGVSKAKSDGSFSISVKRDSFYQISMRFKSRKIEKVFSANDLNKKLQVNFGRFSGNEILNRQ